jgi:septal ring factor EnvC (AmiA/AmiB activator)
MNELKQFKSDLDDIGKQTKEIQQHIKEMRKQINEISNGINRLETKMVQTYMNTKFSKNMI